MKQDQRKEFTTLVGGWDFIDVNTAKLGSIPQSGAKRKLDEAIEVVRTHESAQVESGVIALQATRTHDAARRTLLHDHMAAIAAVAKDELQGTPELEMLKMVRGDMSVQTMIAAAQQMAKGGAPHASIFIGAGLDDFVAQLEQATAGMIATLHTRKVNVGRKAGATTGIRTALASGRRQLAILDRLVRVALKGDDALLRNWAQVKRIPKSTSGGSRVSSAPVLVNPHLITPAVVSSVAA